MDNLPTPLNRVELYLGTAAQMPGVTPPEEPLSRLEQYLAFIAGDTSVELPAPASLCEQWLAYVAGITPAEPLKLEGAFHVGVQKVDVRFFAAAAGMPGVVAPEPQNRTEQYWAKLAEILPVHGVLKYATGTNLTLTDVAWWRMGLERINGDTAQQTYTGKNLFDGLMEDGGYSQSTGEKVNSGTQGRCVNPINVQPNTAYVVSIDGVKLSLSARYFYYDSSNNLISSEVNADGAFTTPENCYYVTFHSSALRTAYPTYDIPDMMIEAGDTVTAFEPYVGGVPAPNPDYPQAINTVTGEQTVAVQGKNLFNKDDFGLLSGYFWEGNTIVVTPGYVRNRVLYIPCQPNTTYSITLPPLTKFGLTSRVIANLTDKPAKDVEVRNAVSNSNMTELSGYTTDSTAHYIGIWLQAPNDGTDMANIISDIASYIQIEQNATVTEYEPYQKTEYKINLESGNLYDKNGAYKHNDDAYLDITVKPNTTYVFSTGRAWTGAFLFDNNGDQTRKVGNDYSLRHEIEFTTRSNEVKATLIFYIASADVKTYDYTGVDFYEKIELCNILSGYGKSSQDYIYKNEKDWYIHYENAKIALDGSEGWAANSGVFYSWPKTDTKASIFAMANYTSLVADCTHFNKRGYDANVQGSFYAGSSNVNFNWDNSHNNLASFKTWLANNNVLFYGQRKTAIETKITEQALISQLNALDRAILPQPIAYITASGDLPGELKISYYGEEE